MLGGIGRQFRTASLLQTLFLAASRHRLGRFVRQHKRTFPEQSDRLAQWSPQSGALT